MVTLHRRSVYQTVLFVKVHMAKCSVSVVWLFWLFFHVQLCRTIEAHQDVKQCGNYEFLMGCCPGCSDCSKHTIILSRSERFQSWINFIVTKNGSGPSSWHPLVAFTNTIQALNVMADTLDFIGVRCCLQERDWKKRSYSYRVLYKMFACMNSLAQRYILASTF